VSERALEFVQEAGRGRAVVWVAASGLSRPDSPIHFTIIAPRRPGGLFKVSCSEPGLMSEHSAASFEAVLAIAEAHERTAISG